MDRSTDHNSEVVGQFSRQAEGYRKLTSDMAGGDRQASFRALFRPAADDHALDVCCGSGSIALDLAPHVARVTGLDLTPAMLDQARTVQAQRDIDNIEWVEGDVCNLPFTDESFSIVLCGAAFHHLIDPALAFREMVRVCRPGGRIVVRDVTPAAEKSQAYDRMEKLRDPSHTHALTPAELAGLGEGLSVSEPDLTPSVTADLPLDAILATSYPEACTIEDIRNQFLEDARSGEDRLGFGARLIDEEIRVSYRMTTAVWSKA